MSIEPSNSHQPLIENRDGEFNAPQLYQENRKAAAVGQSAICRNLTDAAKAAANSKIIRATAITLAALLLVFFLCSNPVGWIVSAIGVSVLVAKILFFTAGFACLMGTSLALQAPLKGSVEFELSAMARLFKKENFHQIDLAEVQFIDGLQVQGAALYLGALPNRLSSSSFEGILKADQDGEGGTVISINESWERDPQFVSIPYSSVDYDAMGIAYIPQDSPDHELLSSQKMDSLADRIKDGLTTRSGRVYVHCRAGVGRSATAIAAFLMKYTTMSIEQICHLIKTSRPDSTIWNKLPALVEFDKHLMQKNGHHRPDRNVALNSAIDHFTQNPGSKGKFKKLPTETQRLLKQNARIAIQQQQAL